jgi:hypothetical protein
MADGEVNKDTVIEVLRANGVDVFPQQGSPDIMVFAKGDILEAKRMASPTVSRRMLHYFQRKFDIPIYHFYHPDGIPNIRKAT